MVFIPLDCYYSLHYNWSLIAQRHCRVRNKYIAIFYTDTIGERLNDSVVENHFASVKLWWCCSWLLRWSCLRRRTNCPLCHSLKKWFSVDWSIFQLCGLSGLVGLIVICTFITGDGVELVSCRSRLSSSANLGGA